MGTIAAAHGVRGEVRIKSFTADPTAIGRYGPVEDETGERRLTLKVRGQVRGLVIARIDGVVDRNQAEALRGLRLYIPRDRLPKAKRGEWYVADLIGLKVVTLDGAAFGTVKAVHNFGAGDVLEIARNGTTEFLPFTKRVVPEVDIEGGRLIVDPPVEIEARPDEEDDESAETGKAGREKVGRERSRATR